MSIFEEAEEEEDMVLLKKSWIFDCLNLESLVGSEVAKDDDEGLRGCFTTDEGLASDSSGFVFMMRIAKTERTKP